MAEGQEIGRTTETGQSAFCAAHGIQCEAQFKAARAAEGEMSGSMAIFGVG